MGIRYSPVCPLWRSLRRSTRSSAPQWSDLRGIEVVPFGVSSVKASEEDEAMLKEMQRTTAYA